MALEKITVLNKLEVLETGHIQVRYATRILEDGLPVSPDSYTRLAFEPGATLPPDIDKIVSQVSSLVWTPEVVAAHVDVKSKQAKSTIS